MDVFIIGISGGVGRLLARSLQARGDRVHGLVRREQYRADLASWGALAHVGDLASMTARELATAFGTAGTVVYSAGSNGGSKEVTDAIDHRGVVKAIEAARLAGAPGLALVSVLPEAGRGQGMSEEEEYYFAVKKKAEMALTRSGLDWLILRPSMLTDGPGTGRVSLGPAESHDEVSREDVAATLAELLHEPRISRQILELNTGSTPLGEAVRANTR
ncbi:NAD(P)H-binding protein [Streptomyces sp. JJ36]|uniref:NAD(P)H-binding protein n=1 Tax=Streptomyces sp. JJ36 TaxID=2736645 RepID=UPI001F208FAC|nr:NAD(P)H-binding protein [Streptomyces sp. JJ36]MCF6523994.1 NAD(P)H-binding protein [Streptomyces sp. JJ36]